MKFKHLKTFENFDEELEPLEPQEDDNKGIKVGKYGLESINQGTLEISFKIYYDDNILMIKANVNNRPMTLEIVKISEDNFEAFGETIATSEGDAIRWGVSKIMDSL